MCEIDLSENVGIKVNEFLTRARDVCKHLGTVVFAENKNLLQFDCDPIDEEHDSNNGLMLLKRLDLQESLSNPYNLQFLIKSSALQSL